MRLLHRAVHVVVPHAAKDARRGLVVVHAGAAGDLGRIGRALLLLERVEEGALSLLAKGGVRVGGGARVGAFVAGSVVHVDVCLSV